MAAADAVVISTAHKSVDYDALLRDARLVVDTRGVYQDGGTTVVKA